MSLLLPSLPKKYFMLCWYNTQGAILEALYPLDKETYIEWTYETKYSRVDQVNFKGCLPQILLGPFLNTLSHMTFRRHPRNCLDIFCIFNLCSVSRGWQNLFKKNNYSQWKFTLANFGRKICDLRNIFPNTLLLLTR